MYLESVIKMLSILPTDFNSFMKMIMSLGSIAIIIFFVCFVVRQIIKVVRTFRGE